MKVDSAIIEQGDWVENIAAGSWPLFAFGVTSQASADYRVQGIQHQKDLIATLTLVDDAPAVSTADSGVIPPYCRTSPFRAIRLRSACSI